MAAASAPPPNRNLKKGRFVDTMRLNVLRDLLFNRNHLLKSSMISTLELLQIKKDFYMKLKNKDIVI